jgi:hypothetical protein
MSSFPFFEIICISEVYYPIIESSLSHQLIHTDFKIMLIWSGIMSHHFHRLQTHQFLDYYISHMAFTKTGGKGVAQVVRGDFYVCTSADDCKTALNRAGSYPLIAAGGSAADKKTGGEAFRSDGQPITDGPASQGIKGNLAWFITFAGADNQVTGFRS